MTTDEALVGILGALEDQTEPLTTCYADGCLCRPSERCPACRARLELPREVS
jgi:hypothetical protein